MATTEHVTACPLDCPDACSLTVTVTDGRVTEVDAAPGNPLTDGWICQKVRHHARRVYAPERVLTPLIRTGPKGAGEFRDATWDEALDLIVDRLHAAERDHGPESVLPFVYNSSAPVLQDEAGERLWRRFGASRLHHTVCAATQTVAYHSVYGAMLSADVFDVPVARLVVVWGANPTVSNTHLAPLVTQAQQAGARVVVVDPRATAVARRADLHLAVRPGTDVVLAYAIADEFVRQDLLDDHFLAEHVTGAEEFLAAARQFPAARAAEICGVDADAIETLATWWGTIRPGVVRVGWGLERNRNGGSGCAAVFSLPALVGQFGTPGSGVVGSLGSASPITWDAREPDTPEDRRRPRAFGMNRIGAALLDDALDPPIRVLFVQGSNLAVTNPDQTAVLRGLAREDLFTVVHDQVLTDTARFADVVLPAATHFELQDLADSYGSFTVQEVRPVIDRVGESRSNNEVAADLARRLGYDLARFDVDAAAVIGRLRNDGPFEGVTTTRPAGGTVQFRDTFPSHRDGKARLASLPGLGVPRYEPLEDPYPLTLLTPSTPRTINSIFGEFQPPDPAVRLHPDDAAAREIADGDPVVVHNDRAAVPTVARLDRSLRPGVATMPKGSWCRDFAGGLTANALTPDTLSDLADGACFNDTRVEVARTGETGPDGG